MPSYHAQPTVSPMSTVKPHYSSQLRATTPIDRWLVNLYGNGNVHKNLVAITGGRGTGNLAAESCTILSKGVERENKSGGAWVFVTIGVITCSHLGGGGGESGDIYSPRKFWNFRLSECFFSILKAFFELI